MFCSTIRSPAIYSLDNFWIVEDLGSTNGSFLGQRAKKRVTCEAMRFKVNSILILGDVKIKLRYLTSCLESASPFRCLFLSLHTRTYSRTHQIRLFCSLLSLCSKQQNTIRRQQKKMVDVKTKTCSKKNMIAKTKPLQKISSNCPPRCNHVFYLKI